MKIPDYSKKKNVEYEKEYKVELTKDGVECFYNILLEEKNKEIERLNNDIKELLKENENKEKVIKAQDNIIKEVREYIEYQLENLDFEEDTKAKMLGAMVLVLLDKENNNANKNK